jgi:hypothetical protein
MILGYVSVVRFPNERDPVPVSPCNKEIGPKQTKVLKSGSLKMKYSRGSKGKERIVQQVAVGEGGSESVPQL